MIEKHPRQGENLREMRSSPLRVKTESRTAQSANQRKDWNDTLQLRKQQGCRYAETRSNDSPRDDSIPEGSGSLSAPDVH
jgi:hypothetical protein